MRNDADNFYTGILKTVVFILGLLLVVRMSSVVTTRNIRDECTKHGFITLFGTDYVCFKHPVKITEYELAEENSIPLCQNRLATNTLPCYSIPDEVHVETEGMQYEK